MKLRIKGNSIRLRLGGSEVARLVKDGLVSESTQFAAAPGNQLIYAIVTSPDEKQISATLRDNVITIKIPESMGREWAGSAQVSLKCEQRISAEATLFILIEKDFACLADRPGEDESDAYPNPARNGAD